MQFHISLVTSLLTEKQNYVERKTFQHFNSCFPSYSRTKNGVPLMLTDQLSVLHNHQYPRPEVGVGNADQVVLFEMEPQKKVKN